jgi:hypothetical protein
MYSFLAADDENIPVNIVNLTQQDHFEGRSFAVVQISYEISNRKRRLAETSRPRLRLFVEEIDGGGGK